MRRQHVKVFEDVPTLESDSFSGCVEAGYTAGISEPATMKWEADSFSVSEDGKGIDRQHKHTGSAGEINS